MRDQVQENHESLGRQHSLVDQSHDLGWAKLVVVDHHLARLGYPMAFESAEDVAEHLPRFIDSYNDRRLHSALGYLSPNRFEEEQPRKPVKTAA